MKNAAFLILIKILKGLVIFFTKIIFKIEVRGLENIPKNSGALIISNHVSFLDNLVIVASLPRNVGFVMAAKVYKNPMLHWILKRLPMVPIETGKNRDYLEKFNVECQEKINEGNLVCVFAEGQISRNGHLLEFKKGIEYIGKGLNESCKFIPVHIDGLLGTPLSYDNVLKKNVSFRIKNFAKKIVVTIGEPMNNRSSAFEVRQAIKELEVHNFSERIPNKSNLIAYVETKLGDWNDESVIQNYAAEHIWQRANLFAATHQNLFAPYDLVGIHLQDSVDETIANLGLAILGKQCMNFKENSIEKSELNEAGIEFLISSKIIDFPSLIFEKTKEQKGLRLNTIDLYKSVDLVKFDSKRDYFSMTHENILAYFFALKQLFALGNDSKIYCKYESDTAIGYFIKIWTPFIVNTQILDANTKQNANVLIGDASFINEYNSEFGTNNMRTIILLDSAESDLDSSVKKEAVYQGLSSQSACPVLTLNSPDFVGKSLEGKIITQEGRKIETVGRPLPGITIKIVNDLGENLGADTYGKILAKGALFGEKGWINTGVTGKMTTEGFLVV